MNNGKHNPTDPRELAAQLERQRGLDATRRADQLERERAQAAHTRARADVAEQSRHAGLARAEREEQARADAELARLYRQFRSAGERTRIRSQMARSGEARALGLEQLRRRNLMVLVPLLIGFGIWSTTGVQQGAARLMSVTSHQPVWWVLWGLEALLIGVVCWIIVVRARLAASGGELAESAERILFGALTVSIVLNLVAALPAGDAPHTKGWAVAVVGAMFAHALGPVGAATVAHLIGTIDKSISGADPWHDDGVLVPRLADMDLTLPTDTQFAHQVQNHQPAQPQTAAPLDPEAWVAEQSQVAARQIEAWLSDQQPPEQGAASPPPAPRSDSPHGAAAELPPTDPPTIRTPVHIDTEQPEPGPTPHAEPTIRTPVPIEGDQPSERGDASHHVGREPERADGIGRVLPAVEARLALGASTRHRIAQYLAEHPNASDRQIAAALGLDRVTVLRHRHILRNPAPAPPEEGGASQ